MAAYAVKTGAAASTKEWANMGEAQKQMIRLNFAEEMQKSAGATGQAARESNSLENQMGNLKQTWTNFQALVGKPLLGVAIQGIQFLSGYLSEAGELVKKFQKNWEDLKTPLTIGAIAVGALVTAMKLYSWQATLAASGQTMWNVVAGIGTGITSGLGAAFAFLTSPITLVVGAIALLAVGFVLAYKKIEPFRDFINGLLGDIKVFAAKVYNEYIKPALDNVVATFQSAFSKIKKFWDENGAQIIKAFSNFFSIVRKLMEPALRFWREVFSSTFKIVVNLIKTGWSTIQGIFSGAFKIIGGLIKVFTGIFTGDFKKSLSGLEDIFKGAWNVIASGAQGFINACLSIFEGLGNGLSNGIKSALNGVIDGINWLLGKLDDKLKIPKLEIKNVKIGRVSLPKFASGTVGLPADTLGVVNDQKGSNYKEMIIPPNGKPFIPEGRDVVLPMEKGTQIIPANLTKQFMSGLPHFKKGWFGNAWDKVKDIGSDIWDYATNPGKLVELALDKFANIGDLSGIGLDVAKGGVKFLSSKIKDYIKGIFAEGSSVPAGSGAKAWIPVIKRAAQMSSVGNLSDVDLNNVVYRINRESGGNEKIIQSSAVWDINMANNNPARGLLQYIPQTFARYRRTGYGNILNGLHQLLAMFNNTNWARDINRFPNGGWGPTGSRRFDGSHRDGLSYVPFDGYNAVLHKGERVLTAQENQDYSSTNVLNDVIQQLASDNNKMIQLLTIIAEKQLTIDRDSIVDCANEGIGNRMYYKERGHA